MDLRTARAACVALFVAGCGGSHAGDAGSDARGFDGATPDGTSVLDGFALYDASPGETLGTVHGACSTLMNAAAPITPATSTDPLPAPTGGTIADGWYYLVASTTYVMDDGGAPPDVATDAGDGGVVEGGLDAGLDSGVVRGPTRSEALLIVSGSVVYAIGHTGSAADATSTYTLRVTDPHLTLNEVCPAMQTSTIDGYDATATTLALHDSTMRVVDTYMHQ